MDFRELQDKRGKIESLEERIARTRAALEQGAVKLGGIPSHKTDSFLETMAKLIDAEAELQKEVLELETLCRAAEYAIDQLPDQQRRIVRLRNIDGMSWARVSRKTHYGKRHCMRIHAAAMKRLKK